MRLLSDEGFSQRQSQSFGEFGEKNATDLNPVYLAMTAFAALCVNAEFT